MKGKLTPVTPEQNQDGKNKGAREAEQGGWGGTGRRRVLCPDTTAGVCQRVHTLYFDLTEH